MVRRSLAAIVVLLALGPAAETARGAVRGDVAALQVALRATGLYAGDVDGLAGPLTARAVRRFQRRAGLVADGVAGPRTRAALGRRGRPAFGSRTIGPGAAGWDVARLQFELARHGFPSGPLDGGFGPRVGRAVVRFQAHAGLPQVGVVGPATRAALRRPPARSPLRFGWPIAAPIGDRFGPRGGTWHPGVDFPAPSGRVVVAAGSGRVVTAGFAADGYGNRVVLDHGSGVRTLAAHLSSVLVRVGTWVGRGAAIGRVGSTGFSTGPHLHFEVLVRGAAVDPLGAIG